MKADWSGVTSAGPILATQPVEEVEMLTSEHSTELKRCGRCQQIKPVSEFGFEKKRGRYRCYCRSCHRKNPDNPRVDIRDRTEKLCPRCKTIKPIAEFRKKGQGDNRDAKIWHYCRLCNTEACRERMRGRIRSGEARKEYKERYKTKRWQRLLTQYGITQEEYERLEKGQDFKCAICNQPETRMYKDVVCRLVVDHDHESGRVRGLLCYACNLVLGYARDSVSTLSSAIDYLEQNKER